MSRSVGNKAEDAAVRFLVSQGYKILDRNYTCRMGEIDIIAERGDMLCFVEVRMRSNGRYGLPQETIGREKKRKVALTARQYLIERKIEERVCRFDVVTIVGNNEPVLQTNAYEDDTYKNG